MANGQIDIKEDVAPTKELASQTHLHGGTTVHAEEVVIVDAAGNLVGQTAGRLNVDGSGVVQPVSDNGGSLTVDALNLDIRDLVSATDSVTALISKQDLAPASPTAASVGVASAQAVAANASRKGLVLVNTSVNRISLGFGAAAVLNSGITLYPGGAYCMGEYDFDLGAVNAIASAAASNLAIQEYA